METKMDDSLNDAVVEVRARDAEVPCQFISGIAGTGKTYMVKQQAAADPSWGLVCATTGIAAVNLDTVTLNATLGYFDTDSLRDHYLTGYLARKLHDLARDFQWLVVDEVSMMDREQLQLLYRALSDANSYADLKRPMGLCLVGDFAQLPPVKAEWAFRADCWGLFQANTTRLTKVWRQDQAWFLNALNLARSGLGREAMEVLTQHGVEWHTVLDTAYEGTTVIPKNDQVDRFNTIAHDHLPGAAIRVRSRRWGKLRGEWRGIPDQLELKPGAYVMILANHPEFEYANGDCGHVAGYEHDEFLVTLARNGETVRVPRLTRDVSQKDRPQTWDGGAMGDGSYRAHLHYWPERKRYVLGQVEYYPLRLAYASTVHKSQGLSLDRVQVDFRNQFFGQPAMLYVALSRCRTLEGLRLVGDPERFVRQCRVDEAVREWL